MYELLDTKAFSLGGPACQRYESIISFSKDNMEDFLFSEACCSILPLHEEWPWAWSTDFI